MRPKVSKRIEMPNEGVIFSFYNKNEKLIDMGVCKLLKYHIVFHIY
jgi:hypothetical protein